MKFDAVMFDLDGTLVDSSLDIAVSVNFVRERLGLPRLSDTLVQSYVGDGVQRLFARALGTEDSAFIDRAVAMWRPHYENACMVHTAPYPGIPDLLARLHVAGVPLAVVTNKPHHPALVILRALGWDAWFRSIVGGDSTPTRKPDPEMFELALDQLGARGKRVLHVGDSRQDIIGAAALGLVTCAVHWGYGSREDLASADHSVHNAAELAAVLGV